MKVLIVVLVGVSFATAQHRMESRVLLDDNSHCDAVMIHNRHISVEEVCIKGSGNKANGSRDEVTWDGQVGVISDADIKASVEWIRSHSLLSRLTTKKNDLYWDGKRVDLGKVDVSGLWQAIPWKDGVLIYGRTFPRRGFLGSWPFKGHFIEVRDLEPYCAIFFDPQELKGEDLWLNGKVARPFLVFPVPD
jgi:hypothetical protein